MTRSLHRVSCKAAIYDPGRRFVLLVHYTPEASGIPGGHLEMDENPDDAVRRELMEELGLTVNDLERKDFFMHTDGKVILGYTGTISMDEELTINPSEIQSYEWVPVDDIRKGKRFVDSYGDFIVKFA